jgi:general secretion pathway protein G
MFCDQRSGTSERVDPIYKECRPACRPAAIGRENSHRPVATKRGFSLVELMIVIVIIGLLAGVVTIKAAGYLSKAKQNTARHEIATVMQCVETFYGAYGRYPTSEENLAILSRASEKFPEPLLDNEPVDPWGNTYQYKVTGSGSSAKYEIVSYGADGKEGGEGNDADISSLNLKDKAKAQQ